jgi:amino acid adenylation domain-containing protein
LSIRDVRSFEQTNFPITLVSGPGSELSLKISYDRDRFDGPAIERMLGHLATLLLDMAARPQAALSELAMLGAEERRRIVEEWNATAEDFGATVSTLGEAFEAQVRATPNAPALIAEGETLTYAELNRRANALAQRLRDAGAGPEKLVGLHLERSPEMVVALLATLKAGAAYLPLDPDYPAERLSFMLADSGAAVLLTQSHLVGQIDAQVPSVLVVDTLALDVAADDFVSGAIAENLAYVIYTSGSTGAPKGVMVEHRNVLNHARALSAEMGIGPGDRILQFISLSFDAAGEEFYPALLSGAALVLPGRAQALIGPELPAFCEQHGVTILHMPAAVWHTIVDDLLVRDVGFTAPVRLLTLGGDAPDPARLAAFGQLLGRDIPFLNLYGPTEATITTTLYRTTTGTRTARLPIGRPIANARVYVLDKTGQPAPVGVPGEIHIGGAGVARGYLNRPELTDERFVPDPFANPANPVRRMYRTGDLGRWLPDGNLEFLGRADNQVKIRGFRVEPGEIEAALKREPGVREAVVLPWEAGAAGKRLVAYLVPANGGELDPPALRASLRGHLPDHMIPSAFVSLPALPLTTSGKLDRAALKTVTAAELEDLSLGTAAYEAPRTPDEELLAGIFGQIVGASRIGINDSFFDLGGHSLLATRLASRIREVFGVELALRDLFESPTVAGIAARIAAARSDEATVPAPPIAPAPRPDNPADGLPLSFAQQRLWFLDQLEPGNLFYNIPTVLRLRGLLDVPALTDALNAIVCRHEVLRTTFVAKSGVPRQVIAPALALDVPVTDLRAMPAGEREARALEIAREEIRRPFDLAAGPLLRARLIELADDERIAVLTIHHIVADGWSMGVFVAELAKLYEARANGEANLSPLPVQYADYALWQRAWLEGSPLERQLDYWKKQLTGAPARLDLPTDRPRPAVQSSNGRTHTFRFSPELSQGLARLSQSQGVTLFMTLLAGYQALLARYSGQGDVVVGSALANRQQAEVEPLIGFFVNTLVFRTRSDGNPTFKELLARVRETALGAYAHQDVPFEMLVDTLMREGIQPERSLSHSPLFQAALSLQNVPVPVRELPGLTLEPVNIDKGIAGFDMLLQVTETPDGLACAWEYNSDLFDASTIERMAGHLQTLFAAAVADPAQPVATLPLLTETERHTVLVEWNNTGTLWDLERTFHGLFEQHAARIPGALAAVFALPGAEAVQSLTYAELDRRANQVARHLLSLGVQKGALVGISTERSLEMVTGILGILKAGAAYLPLDPTYPPDRLSFMLSDSGVVALLTQSHLVGDERDGRLPLAGFSAPVIRLDFGSDAGDWPAIAAHPDTPPAVSVSASELAYCIYTSGSTGRPKGVLVRHRGMINLAEVHHREFDMREGKRVLQFSPFSFDASVWETVMALGNGATLVLTRQETLASGPELLRLMQEQRITTVTLPPSLLSILSPSAAGAGSLPDLDTVIAAGERCVDEIVRAWAPGRKFFNAYGPTETTVCASMHLCDPEIDWPFGGPPIGKPLANFQLYVTSDTMQPQPIGVPGELLVGGPSLAQGYLNRPELTAERFIRNPFVAKPGFLPASDRLYRTGDLVRWLPGGNLEFLGRIDDQVKVRGFRIELGEIESVLREHPSVVDAVVAARDNALLGYFIPADPAADSRQRAADLRSHLRARLPEYMVPSALIPMDAFPLTPAGKIDRRSLPAADQARRDAAAEYVAPRTGTEARLAAIAAQLLNLERVGVEDNFFELGGHSLLATQLISRIRDEFKVEAPLKALFEHPTVAGLAVVVDEGLKKQAAEQAKVADALAMVKGMTPEQVKALLAAKKAQAAGQGQGERGAGA